MMKVLRAVVALVVIASLAGCAAHTHVVGRGGGDPYEGRTIEKRQWYILWGLVQLNEVYTEDMVGNARHKLEQKGLDLIVANDITAADSGFDVATNKVTLIDRNGNLEELPLLSKREVADRVLDRVAGMMK